MSYYKIKKRFTLTNGEIMTTNPLNDIFSKNLAALRQKNHMTQAELADKLNYSDKSVSKWERGESIPDVTVLHEISGIFGVSIDTLLTDPKKAAEKVVYSKVPTEKEKYSQHMNIVAIVLTGVWLVALAVFIGLWSGAHLLYWKLFVYTLPLSFLLLIIFSAIWAKNKTVTNAINVSLFILTFLLSIFVGLLPGKNVWYIFFLMIPAEIIVALSFHIYDGKQKRKGPADGPESVHEAVEDVSPAPDGGKIE